MFYLKTFLLVLLLSLPVFSHSATLYNYLGTGSPRLYLELSPTNGPGWKSFNIDYQQSGSIPWSADPSLDWSPWNVKDTQGNYYGTITLHSNNKTATFEKYDGKQLQGIHFTFNERNQSFEISVDKVIGGKGPFPDAPIATPAKKADGTPYILSVKGPNIVNQNNEKITLKGMVRPSLEWNAQGEHLNKEDIQKIAQWSREKDKDKGGSNVIRIDLNQEYWNKSGPKTEIGSYKQIIDAIIYYATLNKMAVILDLHWVNDKDKQTQMANLKSILFWAEVAKEYKNFGTVIFELYNEPNNISPEVWLNGDKKNFAGNQELYDAVRKTGAKNICIVNGLDYAYDLSFVGNYLIKGDNIVYGSHPYTTKGEDSWPISAGGNFENNYKSIRGKYPIIFTEFGVNDPKYYPSGYEEKYKNMLKEIVKDDINYTGFAWWVDNKDPAFPALIGDWNGKPINGGKLIEQDMKDKPATFLDIH